MVFAAKPYDMSSVPGTYMVEEEKKKKKTLHVLLCPTHLFCSKHIITHM